MMLVIKSTVVHALVTKLIGVMFVSDQALATFCQVYPSEYAYLNGSVDVQEEPSVNCRRYPHGLGQGILLTENYLHCNGTQLKLADSDLGPERYTNSDYYVWPTGAVSNQLLFIFPTRVTLSSITLHYYSDSDRGLPRLRFFAVPDDFNIWEAPSASYSYVEVAAVPPGGDPAGRRRVNVKCYLNTLRVLMINSGSTVHFAVSEVEFFTCAETTTGTPPKVTKTHLQVQSTTSESVPYFKETFSTPVPGASGTSAEFPHDHVADEKMGTLICNHTVSVNEILGWTLAAVSMVLFVVSFTINVIMLWVYRKRQSKDNNVESPMYEMEGNPCYESKLQQSADTTGQQEAHVYERVKLRN